MFSNLCVCKELAQYFKVIYDLRTFEPRHPGWHSQKKKSRLQFQNK